MATRVLVAASAALVILLGLVHLGYTFWTRKLSPRDRELEARMQLVPLVLSPKALMGRAWVGFNASHGLGLLGFGLVYGYLALFQLDFLLHTPVLVVVGGLWLWGYVVLALRYWFSVPLRAVALALALYLVGFAVAWH